MRILTGLAWRERVRGGLLVILSFFDREPALARVCVVQALQGGPQVFEWREEILARLAGIVDEGRAGERAGAVVHGLDSGGFGRGGVRDRVCAVVRAQA